MDVQSLKQDDFEETLVHEVIQENPVEEQGIRPEWQARAGWHQKEYVHLRGADPKQQNDNNLNADGGSANSDVKRSVEKSKESITVSNHNEAFWAVLGAAAAVTSIVFIFLSRVRTRHKIRKQ